MKSRNWFPLDNGSTAVRSHLACRHAAPSAHFSNYQLASTIELDVLNVGNGDRHNVEIGGTTECDPLKNSDDWLRAKLKYNDDHFIRGLYEMHREHSREPSCTTYETINGQGAFSFADYVLFLGARPCFEAPAPSCPFWASTMATRSYAAARHLTVSLSSANERSVDSQVSVLAGSEKRLPSVCRIPLNASPTARICS